MYSKILVPIDGSKRAERVLPHVEELAIQNNSEVIFFMISKLKGRAPSQHDSDYYIKSMERQKTQAEAYLKGIQGVFKGKNLTSKGYMEFGNPIEAICQKALEEKVDLIAISSHGHVSYRSLTRKSAIPILMITS